MFDAQFTYLNSVSLSLSVTAHLGDWHTEVWNQLSRLLSVIADICIFIAISFCISQLRRWRAKWMSGYNVTAFNSNIIVHLESCYGHMRNGSPIFTLFLALFWSPPTLSVVCCWVNQSFFIENSCLLWPKTALVRAVRVNQNSKVVGQKTKTLMLNWSKGLLILSGFITTSNPSHVTHSHLNHCWYKNTD